MLSKSLFGYHPYVILEYDIMTTGYVAVHCDTGREWYVYDHITQLPHIKETKIVLGLYDIICKLETSTTKELENDVMKIRKISHVQTTMTLIVF